MENTEHRQAAKSVNGLMIGQLPDHSLGDVKINVDGAQSCPFSSALRMLYLYRSEFGNADNLETDPRQH